jgi:hypothetical protein
MDKIIKEEFAKVRKRLDSSERFLLRKDRIRDREIKRLKA